jgi:WD40 repeat protein
MSGPAFDVKQAHVVKTLAHDAPLIAGRFDPNGRHVFATSQDQTVVRWRLDNDVKLKFAGHESWVFAIAFCDGGQTLLSAGGDGRLIWWGAADDKPAARRTVSAHDGWARCVAVSPDDRLVATGGNDNLVKVWSAADGRPVHAFAGHANRVYSVLFHPDGRHLLSGDLMGSVRAWDLSAGKGVGTLDAKELHTYDGGQQVDFGGVRGLAVSPDQTRVACGGLYKASNPLGAVHEPLVVLFDWAERKKVRTQTAPGIAGGVIWRLRFLPDQTLAGVCGGSSGGLLLFWKLDQDKDFHRFQLPALARDFDLHPTDPLAATMHHDGKVRLTRLAAPAKL